MRSIICLVAVWAAMYSLPYIAIFTVVCFLEYQSPGVLLKKYKIPVMDCPVIKSWYKLASTYDVMMTLFPCIGGALSGT